MERAESEVSKEIKEYLELCHIKYWRNNVFNGKIKDIKTGKVRHLVTGIKGLSDFAALLPNGQTLYIEAKKKKGKVSDFQKDFESDCQKTGNPYVIVTAAIDLSEFLKTYFSGTEYYHKFLYI